MRRSEVAKRLLALRFKSQAPRTDVRGPLISLLFEKQKSYVLDTAEFATAVCSRQAGKTTGMIFAMLLCAAERPDRNIAYLGLTRKSAKTVVWRDLKKLARKLGLVAEWNQSELLVTFDNGSIIQLTGANDSGCVDTLRGLPWDLVVIDEAASYRGHVEYLIEEVIEPSFVTRHGKLRLIGTPSGDFNSYFYRSTHNEEYSHHHWTIIDNPHIPDPVAFLERLRKRKGWTEDNPVYLREYCGLWSRSTENQVYAYNPLRNQCMEKDVPAGMHYVLGVDLGWNDSDAIVVLAYNPQITNKIYVVYQWKKSKVLIGDLGKRIKEVVARFKPVAQVCDEGGLGKKVAEELNARFGLSLVPANKTQKLAYIGFLNSDLEAGNVQIVDEEKGLAEEWNELIWKDDAHTMEHPACPNHISDATLYSYRECTSYLHEIFKQQEEELEVAKKQEETDDEDGIDRDFDGWGGVW